VGVWLLILTCSGFGSGMNGGPNKTMITLQVDLTAIPAFAAGVTAQDVLVQALE